MARRGQGEGKPEIFDDRCAGGCGRKGKPRVFNTCGRQGCIQKVNEDLAGGPANQDPAAGQQAKINGKWHKVAHSGSNRHGHFVKLKDGHTVSLDQVQDWK